MRRPTLSVVIPVYNVEAYLAECLDSVLAQGIDSLEVIVVDDGSTDRSPDILSYYARADERIRVYRQTREGQARARNVGVTHARGAFLTFVDADDRVPAGGHRAMLRSLRASGSDLVVGGTRRLHGRDTYRPSWDAAVHERDRIGVSIEQFPHALLDVIACNRMFRTDFWRSRIRAFPERTMYEDHVPMVAAYLRASRFDVLARVTYEWRLRQEGTSTGQQKHELRALIDRIGVKRDAELILEDAPQAAKDAWLGRILDIDLPPYLDHALRGDDEYRRTLAQALAHYLGEATSDALMFVRVQQKVRTYLASRDRWDDLERAQRFFRSFGSIPPTTFRGGAISLDDTIGEHMPTPIPDKLLELSSTETRLQVCLLHAEWAEAGRLVLTGWAIIRGVDLASRHSTLDLRLVSADGSKQVALPVEHVELPQATRWVDWPHGSFEDAGFRTTVDALALSAVQPKVKEWRLRARLSVGAALREGGVHHAVAGSSATHAVLGSTTIPVSGLMVTAGFDGEHGFTVALRHPQVVDRPRGARSHGPGATSVRIDPEAIHMRIEPGGHRVVKRMCLSNGSLNVLVADLSGVAEEIDVHTTLGSSHGQRALPSGEWAISLVDGAGRVDALRPTGRLAGTLPLEGVSTTHRVRIAYARAGACKIELAAPLRDEELGSRAQWRLREEYRPDVAPGLDAVFSSASPPDGPLWHLAQAVARQGSVLPTWWSVPDLATDVPNGTMLLLRGSRAWHERLAAARSIWADDDVPAWIVKRPQQRMVRVFVSPADAVGRAAWWDAGYTPGRIADELERFHALWDALVVPDRSCLARYRRELEWDGRIFVWDDEAITEILDLVLA